MIRIALYQPDIPHNTGAILRLSACLGLEVDLIEPAGFQFSDRALRRSALDYGDLAILRRHADWGAFLAAAAAEGRRIVLFSTRGEAPLFEARFEADDTLLFGRESAGVPRSVAEAAALRVVIPLRPGARSLNVATAAAIGACEALRQTGLWTGPAQRPIEPAGTAEILGTTQGRISR